MWHKINIHNSKRKTPRKQNTPKFKIKGGTHLLYIIVKKQVVLRGGGGCKQTHLPKKTYKWPTGT